MPANRYINIHTHHASIGDAFSILNVAGKFDNVGNDVSCSMGLHPWYIKRETLEDELLQLGVYAKQPNVLAIGECGLDRVTETPWDLQLSAFEQQVQLVNAINKPLIIHCVRAYEEVLEILLQASVPVVFHGYNKGKELAERIVEQGYYLSFGRHLLVEGSNAAQVLPLVPHDQFFLETDNAEEDIERIYEKAAVIKQIPLDGIILQLQKNCKAVFKI